MGSVCDACYAIKKRNKIFDALSIVIWGNKVKIEASKSSISRTNFQIFEPLITIVKKNQLVRKITYQRAGANQRAEKMVLLRRR